MPKTLTILRHAKADRPEGYDADFDRPLTKRGLHDARRMGELLKRLEPPVDWWISSPALRTRQTTERMIESCSYKEEIQWAPEVYEASAETLLALLTSVPPEAEHAVVVGHNPGMETLVGGLVTGAPGRLNVHMVTCALAQITLEIAHWNQIRWGAGRLELLTTPKALKREQ
jgi:phosphohistidine phosphatase